MSKSLSSSSLNSNQALLGDPLDQNKRDSAVKSSSSKPAVVSIKITTNPGRKHGNGRHTTAKFNDNPSIGETSIGIASLLSACNSVDQDAGDFAALVVADTASLVDEGEEDSLQRRVDPSTVVGGGRKQSGSVDLDRSDRDSTSNKAIASIRSIRLETTVNDYDVGAAASAKKKKNVSIDVAGGLLTSGVELEACSGSFKSERSINPSVTALAGSIR
jgi:hypothetical protein